LPINYDLCSHPTDPVSTIFFHLKSDYYKNIYSVKEELAAIFIEEKKIVLFLLCHVYGKSYLNYLFIALSALFAGSIIHVSQLIRYVRKVQSTVSDLRRSQSGILPRTVSLTIRDCRPIRCTSHDPLYLRSFSLCSGGRRGSAVYLPTMAARALAHITRRTDPARLANNGRGLRSDHNRERGKRGTRGTSKRKERAEAPPRISSLLSHCYRLGCSSLLSSTERSALIYACGPGGASPVRTPRLVNIIGSIRPEIYWVCWPAHTSYRKSRY